MSQFETGDVVTHEHYPTRLMTVESSRHGRVRVAYFQDRELCREVLPANMLHRVGMRQLQAVARQRVRS